MTPTITIVTAWLDHLELVPDYLEAVARGPLLANDELLIIDNGSDPPLELAGSVGHLETIRLDVNRGFSGGSNVGLYSASCDAVLFLNNDVAASADGWLATLRDALEPGVLVGARLCWDRHADVDGDSYPYLDGWCLAGMRDDLLELGGFDEDYAEPAYYSDNDLCFRARAAGMRLREVRVPLVHKKNVTAGAWDDPSVVAARDANRERYRALVREVVAA